MMKMAKLDIAMQHWNTDEFPEALVRELQALHPDVLLLHKAGNWGGPRDSDDFNITVLNITNDEQQVHARIGVFFTEIIAGCSCGDEPAPINGYCELLLRINKSTAETQIEIVQQ